MQVPRSPGSLVQMISTMPPYHQRRRPAAKGVGWGRCRRWDCTPCSDTRREGIPVTAPTKKRPTDVEVPMSSLSKDGASYISERGATISAGSLCPADGDRGSRASHRSRETWTRILAAHLGAPSLPGTQYAGLDGLRSTRTMSVLSSHMEIMQ